MAVDIHNLLLIIYTDFFTILSVSPIQYVCVCVCVCVCYCNRDRQRDAHRDRDKERHRLELAMLSSVASTQLLPAQVKLL